MTSRSRSRLGPSGDGTSGDDAENRAATATVYTALDPKEHLVAEITWRATPSVDNTRLRHQITDEISRRVRAALGPDADVAATRALEDLYADSLIDAGVACAARTDGTENPESFVLRILHR
ncbi:hypothetical protein ACFV24_02285 [Nocardia fluminea]|uniref:hypothetical protein n=1 Tax=Nocardia fluminea TaxID=134984 RepID=UPI00366DE502